MVENFYKSESKQTVMGVSQNHGLFQGRVMLQMSTLLFQKQCQLSVKNLEFWAELSWQEDKSVDYCDK